MRNFLLFFIFKTIKGDFMDGEIDLETYTLSIIRLNSAFKKLENDEPIADIRNMLEDSYNDLNKLYHDIVNDLNQDEVNLNEYYMFFENGKQAFPQYIDALGNIENNELDESVNSLLNVFNNLNKIAEAFPKNEMME